MSRTRLALMLTGLASLALAAHATGVTSQLTPAALQEVVQAAGPWGIALYLLAFAAGTLASVPGLVFILAALLVWGPVHGGAIALIGGVLSAALSFCTLRRVGGGPGATTSGNRVVRWALGLLEARPVAATATLRALTVLAPPVNVALALSPIRARDYVIGTALGLVAPIAVYATFFDCLVAKAFS